MTQGFFSTKRTILTTFLSLLLLGVGGALSYAAPTPSVISYQGFLTSATGTAQTGTTTITIRIYDAATSGTLLYEELHPTTPIANGYFTVQIGSVGDVNGGTTASSITDLTFDRSYYVTVELAAPFATGEMTLTGGARSQLGTVPFANVAYGALQATSSTGLLTQKGRMYFNTGDNQLYIYDGSSWNPLSVLSSTPTFSTLTVTGTTSLQAASSTALTVSGPTFLNALTLTNASSTGGITATTFYGALLGTANLASLTVTGQSTFANASTTNLTATNLYTNNTLSSLGNAITSNVGGSIGTSTIITSNVASSSANFFQSIVNGISSSVATIINSFTQSVAGNVLTTTVNGVTATSSVISSNDISTSGAVLTTTVNGVATSTDLTNLVASSTSNTLTVSTTTNSFTLTSVVNGKTSTTTTTFLNSNDLQSAVNTLTSTVNGLSTSTSIINSSSIQANSGVVTTIINGVTATTSVSNLYTFLASSTNSNLSVSTTSTGLVTYELTDTPVFSSSTITNLTATNATSSNFFSTLLSAVTGIFTDLTATNATATNLVTTNSTSTNSFISSLVATLANITDLVVGNSTTTSAIITNATIANSTTTGSSVVTGTSTLATTTVATLTVTGQTTLNTASATGITSTNIYGTNGVITNATATNLFSTDANITNATSTSFFSSLLSATTAFITTLTATDATFTRATSTDLTVTGNFTSASTSVTNLSTTNSTSTSFFASTLTALTSTISSLTSGALTSGTIIATSSISSQGTLSVSGQSSLSNASTSNLSTTNLTATGTLSVSGQTTLSTASATALSVSGQTVLGNASTTALSATTLYGALIGTTGTFSSTLNVTGDTTLANASTTNVTTSGLFNVLGTTTLATTTVSSLTSNSLLSSSLVFTNASSTGGLTLASLFGANLTSCNSSTEKLLWANGTFTCGTDAGGAGGTITSLNGSSVASQTLATSTLPGVGLDLLITSSTTNGVHTFALSPQAGYSIPLTASSTNWNSFYNTPVSYLTAGANVLFSGTSTISLTPNPTFTTGTFSTVVSGTSTLGNASATALTATNLFATDATFTNATSSTFFSSLLSATTAFITTLTATDATFTRATSTDLTVTGNFTSASTSVANLSTTNSTSTSFFASTLTALTGTISSLTSGALTSGTIIATSSLSSQGTLSVSGQSSLANASTSNLSTTNLTATGTLSVSGQTTLSTASATALTVSGQTVLGNASTTALSATTLYGALIGTTGTFSSTLNVTGNTTLSNASTSVLTAPSLFSTQANITNASTSNITTSGNLYLSGLTAGSVPFIGTGGLVSQNNANFFFDNTNTRLGIGTGTPIATLSVRGAGSTNPFVVASSTGVQLLTLTTQGRLGLGTSSPISTFSLTGTAGTNPLTIASSTGLSLMSIDQAGRLVVGTTTSNITLGNLFVGTTTLQGNISSPTALKIIGNIDNTATTTFSPRLITSSVSLGGLNNPRSIAISGNYAYVANNSSPTSVLGIMDISNPTNPTFVATTSFTVGTAPYALAVSGKYVHIAGGGFRTFDISNPTNPTLVGSSSITTSLSARALTASGNFVYLTDSSADMFFIYDVSNPAAPRQIGSIPLAFTSGEEKLVVQGKYVYVAHGLFDDKFSIIDVSSPSSPFVATTTSVADDPFSIAVSGRYLYVSVVDAVNIYDIASSTSPSLLSTVTLSGSIRSMTVTGRYLYAMAFGAANLFTIDVSSPTSPILLSTTTVPSSTFGFAISGRHLYGAEGTTGMFVVDLGGMESTSAVIHSLNSGNLAVGKDAFIGGNLNVITGLTVGNGGFFSQGNSGVYGSFSVGTSSQPLFLADAANNRINIGTSTGLASLFVQGTSTLNPFTVAATTGDSLFTILSNGNVGIGEASPTGNFVIQSQGAAYSYLWNTPGTSNTSEFFIGDGPASGSFGGFYRYSNSFVGVEAGRLDIINTGNTIRMSSTGGADLTVNSSGNVGVGTSTPTLAKFVVQTSVTNDGAIIFNTDSTGGASVPLFLASNSTATTTNVNIENVDNGNFAIRTGAEDVSSFGTIRFLVSKLGDTTIGLVSDFSPSAALEVVGRNGINPFRVSSSTNDPLLILNQRGSLLLSVADPTFDNAKLVVQGTTTLIGTAGAPTALKVIGNIDNTATSTFAPSVISTVGVQGAGTYVVAVQDSYAYVGNNVSNTLSIIDISNKASPVVLSTTTVGLGAVDIDVAGTYAYLTAYDNSSFNIVDISNPKAPTVTSSLVVAGTPYGVRVAGRYAYITNYNASSVTVIDISAPSRPRVVGTVGVGLNPQSIAISGKYAYVANRGSDSVSVLDITNPVSPVVVATLSTGDGSGNLEVSGRYLYVANTLDGTLTVADVANPTVPFTVATLGIGGGNVLSLDVSGRYAYVTTSGNSFVVVDISNPSSPYIASTNSSAVGSNSYSTTVSGRYAYVTSHTDESLTIIDLGGLESTSAIIHSLEAGNLSVRNDIQTGGILNVGTALTVGQGGFLSQGNSAVYGSFSVGTSTYPNFLVNASNNTTNIGTSTGLASLFVQGTSTLNPFSIASSTGTSLFTVDTTGRLTFTNASSTNQSLSGGLYVTGQSTLATASATALTATSIYNSTLYGTTALLGTTTNTFDSSKLVVQGTTTLIGTTGNPTALRVMGNIDNTATSTFGLRVLSTSSLINGYDVQVVGNYLYTTSVVGTAFRVIDVSNKITPTNVSGNFTVGSGFTYAVYVAGKYAYIPSDDNLFIYNVSNPATISQVAQVPLPVDIDHYDILVSGNFAYISSDNGNIIVVDVGNPFSPRVVSNINVGTNTYKLFAQNNYLYATDVNANVLRIVDITNPYSPALVSSPSTGTSPHTVYVSGSYAYVTNSSDDTLSIINISNPLSSSVVATVSVGDNPTGVYVSGRYVYVTNAGTSDSVSVVDVSSSTNPLLVSSVSVVNNPEAIHISGRYAYVIGGSFPNLSILDLGGLESTSALIHSLEAGNLSVRNDISTGGMLNVGTALTVGSGGLMSQGNSAIYGSLQVGTSTYPNFLVNASNNTTNIGTSTGLASLFIQGTSTLNPFTVASSSGASLFMIRANGNVGVGTSSAYAKLDIYNGDQSTVVPSIRSFTPSGTYGHLFEVGNTGLKILSKDNGTLTFGRTDSVVGYGRLSGSSDGISFSTSLDDSTYTQRMNLSSSGVLGIGTQNQLNASTSNSLLNVAGKIVAGDHTSANGGIILEGRYGAGGALTVLGSEYSSGGPVLGYAVNPSTTTPGEFMSSYGLTSAARSAVTVSDGIKFYVQNSTTSPIGTPLSLLEAMKITSDGNIGIASSSPVFKLGVVGTFGVTDQTTLSTASATALTATTLYSSTLYGTTALLGTTTNTFDTSKLVVEGSTTLIGTAGAPTALKVIGNIDNSFAQSDWPRFITSTTTSAPGDLVVSNGFMYVISGAELSIYNVVDINNPLLISTSSANGNNIEVVGNYVYILGSSFSVVDVTDKRTPVQVGSVSYGSSYGYSVIRGQYAYVSSSVENSLKVIDINDPRQPKVVASLSVGSSPRNLAISGNVLYLVEHGAGGNLYSIDISNPLNPILLDTLGVAGGLQGVQVSNGYVYVQRFTSGGLYIVDASDPSDLSNITSIGTGSGSNDIKISGRYAYVPNYNSDTFSIIDISNPRSPQLVKNVPTSARPSAVYVDSRTLYVSNYNASQVSFYELPGIESVSALIHSLEAGNLSVRNDLSTQGMLTAGTGLTVGSGGFLSQGNSAVYGSLQVGTSTYPNFLVNTGNNTTNIGTSTGLASLFIQGTSTLNPFTVASSTGASLFTVLADGNIGVGTTSPGARFDIKAATNNSLGGLRILSSTNNNVSSRIFDGGDEGFFELLSGGSVNTLLRANGNSYLGGGNVGIGTSSPQTKLHVYGGDIFGQSAVGTANFILGNADGALNAKYSYIGSASGQTAFGRINDDLATKSEFMRIDGSGNVGIGTTSMLGSSKLFVEGSINIPQNYALRANNNWLIGQSSSTNTINIGSTAVAGDIQFDSSSGSGLFIVKSDGNIGIGSTSPFAKLSIGGFSGTGIALTPTDNATILSSFNDSTIDDLEQLRISHNFARVNIDNLRSSLNLQSYGGDVVIGTTSPSGSRLDVYHNTSATSTDIFRILSDVGSSGNAVFKIKANGDVFTDGNTTIGTPADLAENYPTSDPTITPGMVVSLASTTLSWSQSLPNGSTTDYEIAEVKKASLGTEALGVISTRPGILLGGNTTNGIPVAFSGRVPVYVSNENGIVRRGDFLTISSSTPGYAMKQTTNGQSIGRALSDQDTSSTSSLVMMVVENTNRTVTITGIEGLSLLTSSSSPSTLTVRETLTERLQQGYSIVREYVAVTVRGVSGYFDTLFAREIFSNKVEAEVICLKDETGETCINKAKLDSLLLLDPRQSNMTIDSSDSNLGGIDNAVLGTSTESTADNTSSTTESGTGSGSTTEEIVLPSESTPQIENTQEIPTEQEEVADEGEAQSPIVVEAPSTTEAPSETVTP